MDIGLYDVDSHRYPNLALMKISAWHKSRGDNADDRIKDFIGSVGNLVELSKTEDLSYERARFYKGIKNSRKRVQAKREFLPVLGSFEIKKIEG